MAIIVRLDRVLADRKMQLQELSEHVGVNLANLSNLKTGKVKAIRETLKCQPGDLLEYIEES